ncbi:MAG: leucine-rich repeat protein, partial [Bacteroidales bacterium]|nr:leucine-rich repeat protein [Bacteroidales bacterium]
YSCTGLTEITIPDSVTSIGDRAFYGCSGLTTVNFNAQNCTTMGSSSNPVFYNCTSFSTLNIGENVENIPGYAFYGCTGLSEITIPDSITSIGEMAFYGCTGLTTMNFNAKNCTTMGSSSNLVFYNCTSFSTLNIGENVENIPGYAFRGCSGLETITIGNSLESIGDYAFDNCSSLTAVYISNISQWCAISFAGLSTNANPLGLAHNLYINNELVTDLVLPNTITEIKPYVFKNATCLTSVTIPSSVTSIGYQAFYGCSNLTTVNFNAENCTTMGSSSSPVFYNCTSFSTLNIGENVENIPEYAFKGCSGLETITIGNSLESIGDYAFSNCSSLTAVYISDISQWCAISFADLSTDANPLGLAHNLYIDNELVTDLVLPNTITEIKSYAFKNATCLTSVTIPSSVTSIGSQVFYGCSNITIVNFNAENCTTMGTLSSPVFFNNTSITTLNIGERVKSIPDYAFSNCYALTEITIPDSVTSIGQKAFYACSGLTTLNFNAKNCTVMGSSNSHVFDNCTSLSTLNIGENVKILPDCAFYNCSALTDVTIPDSVVSIGERAFYGCSTLATVNFNAENCTTMGSSSYKVFENGSMLTTLNIGEKVKNIPDYAFNGCSNMMGTLVIPDSVINIGTYAFGSCSSLDTLTIGKGVESIGERAFSDCSELTAVNFNAENCTTLGSQSMRAFEGCTSFSTLSIGDNVVGIPENAFYGCSNLTSATIGNSVINIGSNAFSGCSGLTRLIVPDMVTNIGNRAFYNCSGLDSITIGSSVENIGDYAFHYADNITEINALATTPPALGSQVFTTTTAKLEVPCSSSAAYGSASGWSDFDNLQERFGYTLNVSTENEQQGSASITQQPSCSDNSAVITATPATGYRFLQWSDGNTDNPRIVVVTSDITYTAGFKAAYIITATAGEGGTITPSGEVSVDEGESQAFTITPNTGYRIASVLVDGTENVTDQLVDGVYTFENVTASHSIEATFEAIPSASFTTNPEASGDTLSILLEQLVEYTSTSLNVHHLVWTFEGGDTVTSTQDYVPVRYREEGIFLTTLVAYNEDETLSDTATLTVVVSTVNYFTISVTSNNDAYGMVSGGGTYEEGTQVVITATPYEGCQFVSWNDDNTDNPRNITITGDTTFVATFRSLLATYTITATAGENGTITPTGVVTVEGGANQCFSITPNEGYRIAYVMVDNTNVTNDIVEGVYTFENVTADHTIHVEFIDQVSEIFLYDQEGNFYDIDSLLIYGKYVVLAFFYTTCHYSQGEVPDVVNLYTQMGCNTADVMVIALEAEAHDSEHDIAWFITEFGATYPIAPLEDNPINRTLFDDWGLDGTPTYILIQPDRSMNEMNRPPSADQLTAVGAHESPCLDTTYTITVLSNNDAYGSVSGGGTYDEGTEITLTAMPYQGYRFVSWNDNITDNPRTITVTSDSTFVAMFEAEQVQQYTITVLSNNDAYGTVSGGGTYDEGTEITLIAMPNQGYLFDSWEDGNFDNPRSIEVTSDSTFIADFVKCEITQTIDTVVTNFVTVGDHTFYSTGNYTFTIPSETDCDTIFDIRLRVLAEPVYDIGPNPTKSLLNINSDGFISAVEFYSVTGQLVMRKDVNGYEAEFDMEGLVDGVYILRIYGEESSLPAVSKVVKE